MNLFTFILFFILAVISGVIILYLIILGIAPGVKPLDYTGFFLYEPGPGFLLLVGWLFLASILQIYAWAIKKLRQGSKSRLWNRISWAGLVLLLTLEAIMIADFWDFLES